MQTERFSWGQWCSMRSSGGRTGPGSQRVPLFYSQQVTHTPLCVLKGLKRSFRKTFSSLGDAKPICVVLQQCSESSLLGPVISWGFRTAALPPSPGHRDGFPTQDSHPCCSQSCLMIHTAPQVGTVGVRSVPGAWWRED